MKQESRDYGYKEFVDDLFFIVGFVEGYIENKKINKKRFNQFKDYVYGEFKI